MRISTTLRLSSFPEKAAPPGVCWTVGDFFLKWLLTNTTGSRANNILEVGDLSEAEALTYLRDYKKLSEEQAKEIISISGGHFLYLIKCVNMFNNGASFEGKSLHRVSLF